MSIEAAWKTVQEILKERGEVRSGEEERLRMQIRGLAADPEGLRRLAEHVGKWKNGARGGPLLRMSVGEALEAWDKRRARHPDEAGRLARAVADVTEIGDYTHRLSLLLLYRADWEAFAKLIHRELESFGRDDPHQWLQRTYGVLVPREEWLPLFHRLRQFASGPALSNRLNQVIARLEREVGAKPSGNEVTEAANRRPPAPAESTLPPSAENPEGAGIEPAGAEKPNQNGEPAESPPAEQAQSATIPAETGAGPEPTSPPETAEVPARVTKKPKSVKPKKEKPKEAEDKAADLDSCLAEVNRMISRLFRMRDDERTELLQQCALVQRENGRLETEASRLRDRIEDLEAQLERSRRAEAETVERLAKAEARAADREEAARRAGERAERLERELGEALEEIEAAERRARDDVHRANLLAEHAVQGFRSQVRERVLPFLGDVSEDPGASGGLTPEQERLRHRLRQILNALRNLGVDTD